MKKIFSFVLVGLLVMIGLVGCANTTNYVTPQKPIRVYRYIDSNDVYWFFIDGEEDELWLSTSDGSELSELYFDNHDITGDWTKEDVDNWYDTLDEIKRQIKENREEFIYYEENY